MGGPSAAGVESIGVGGSASAAGTRKLARESEHGGARNAVRATPRRAALLAHVRSAGPQRCTRTGCGSRAARRRGARLGWTGCVEQCPFKPGMGAIAVTSAAGLSAIARRQKSSHGRLATTWDRWRGLTTGSHGLHSFFHANQSDAGSGVAWQKRAAVLAEPAGIDRDDGVCPKAEEVSPRITRIGRIRRRSAAGRQIGRALRRNPCNPRIRAIRGRPSMNCGQSRVTGQAHRRRCCELLRVSTTLII